MYNEAYLAFTNVAVIQTLKPHFLRLRLRECVKGASHSPAVIKRQC